MKDLVGIGKTVKTVSDAVRGAVPVLYRPTAIKKEGRARTEVAASRVEAMARAEVRAALIRQEGETALADRAKQRFLFEQSMQQQSLENILVKAVEYSKKQKKRRGRKISEHWLYRLLINSKDVTDEEVQDIFAKLIVEQGSEGKNAISYMTLDALRLLNRDTLNLSRFSANCITFSELSVSECVTPIPTNGLETRNSVNYTSLA
jgi:hypothetical protein